MNRTPFVHIGLPKTGTKTLQWRLFAEHPEIYYLGRFDGPAYKARYGRFDCCRDATVQTVMNEIAYSAQTDPDLPRCRRLLEEALTPAREADLVPVWSWESYATDTLAKRRIRARNLKALFGDARIAITLRNPVALLESAYFQVLKRRNVGGSGKRGRPLFYTTIAAWLEDNLQGSIMPHLEYAETIRTYVDLFGRENVSVLLFENLQNDPAGFIANLCQTIGIDPDAGVRLTAGRGDNARWTRAQLDRLQRLDASFAKSLVFLMSGRKTRRRMLDLDDAGIPRVPGEQASAPMPPEWRKRIFEITADGNRWLVDTYDLPVARYGYFG